MATNRALLLTLVLAPFALHGQRKGIFVDEQLNVAAVLASPPAADSNLNKAELEELHRIQDSRSTEEVARAKQDDAEEDIFIFKTILGDRFTAATLPATALLSAHVHNDEAVIVNPAKTFFHRPRPYDFDHTIKQVCKMSTKAEDYSYPSGHAVSGYLEAFTAALIVPEKRDAILARADDYARNRLICGVHYPSDLAASKSTAYAMFGLMVNNPQFKKELEAAKAETRGLLGGF